MLSEITPDEIKIGSKNWLIGVKTVFFYIKQYF